jgi:hypothetical protein
VERKIRGDLKGTLADWEESIAADPANSNRARLYRALILAQGGQPAAEFAQEVASWNDGSLKAMGQFVAGGTDETALLVAAGKATDQPPLGAQCEAYYCIGVMRLIRGDAAGARELFQKSVATGLRSSPARQFARAELTRLGSASQYKRPISRSVPFRVLDDCTECWPSGPDQLDLRYASHLSTWCWAQVRIKRMSSPACRPFVWSTSTVLRGATLPVDFAG